MTIPDGGRLTVLSKNFRSGTTYDEIRVSHDGADVRGTERSHMISVHTNGSTFLSAEDWPTLRDHIEALFAEAGISVPAPKAVFQKLLDAAAERQEAERIRRDTRDMIETARIHAKALRDAG